MDSLHSTALYHIKEMQSHKCWWYDDGDIFLFIVSILFLAVIINYVYMTKFLINSLCFYSLGNRGNYSHTHKKNKICINYSKLISLALLLELVLFTLQILKKFLILELNLTFIENENSPITFLPIKVWWRWCCILIFQLLGFVYPVKKWNKPC